LLHLTFFRRSKVRVFPPFANEYFVASQGYWVLDFNVFELEERLVDQRANAQLLREGTRVKRVEVIGKRDAGVCPQ